jgi:hypothetical protein
MGEYAHSFQSVIGEGYPAMAESVMSPSRGGVRIASNLVEGGPETYHGWRWKAVERRSRRVRASID